MAFYRNYSIVDRQEPLAELKDATAHSLLYDVFTNDGLEVKTGFTSLDEAKAYIDSVSSNEGLSI